jgi:hypothetical protein
VEADAVEGDELVGGYVEAIGHPVTVPGELAQIVCRRVHLS